MIKTPQEDNQLLMIEEIRLIMKIEETLFLK
jgi:hypothetical protein